MLPISKFVSCYFIIGRDTECCLFLSLSRVISVLFHYRSRY